MPRTLTALYDNRASADAARDRLIQAGVSRSEIDVHDQTAYGDHTAPAHKGGMMEGLKNMFSSHEDHHAYGEGLSRGNTLLSATVDDAQVNAAYDILDGSGAIDFDRSQEDWRASGWTGQPAGTGAYADTARTGGASDDVIQVAEERLVVGKREVERGGVRVRSYVVETPVSEQVRLREERVSIERRPVNRPLAAGDNAFQDRTVELRETGEEAVVGKNTVVTEEIGIRKDVGERTEEVRGTVRHTEVEVEDLGTTTGRPADRRV